MWLTHEQILQILVVLFVWRYYGQTVFCKTTLLHHKILNMNMNMKKQAIQYPLRNSKKQVLQCMQCFPVCDSFILILITENINIAVHHASATGNTVHNQEFASLHTYSSSCCQSSNSATRMELSCVLCDSRNHAVLVLSVSNIN